MYAHLQTLLSFFLCYFFFFFVVSSPACVCVSFNAQVQTQVRMCLARAYLLQRKKDHAAAIKVQAIWRGSYQCRAYKQFQNANAERIPSAIVVQTRFRANRARQKVKLLSEGRHRTAEQASTATCALDDVSGRTSRRLLVAASYAAEGAKWTSPAYRTCKDTVCTCSHVPARFVLFFVPIPALSRSLYTRCPFKSSCLRVCEYYRHSFSLCRCLNLFVWYPSTIHSCNSGLWPPQRN